MISIFKVVFLRLCFPSYEERKIGLLTKILVSPSIDGLPGHVKRNNG